MGITGDLPAYMRIGRSSMPGPVTGGMLAFTCGPFTPTGTGSAVIHAAIKLPFDFRVEAIYWRVRTAPGTAGVLTFEHNSTDATGGTNLLGAASIDITTDLAGFATAETSSPVGLTATLADRTIVTDRFIVIAANITNLETAPDMCFGVIGFPMTHIHDNPAND